MLASANRLRKAYEISRVYKRGVYGSSAGLLSVKAYASGRSESRSVVVVGKKVSKRAVVRNRIRRRILGELQLRWATVRAGYDIVISVHKDVSELQVDKLSQVLNEALERVHVITT
jgi:ribonuclease P protein component